jgi:glycosyltransferase involved in cell wall biosynthesis/2-polyprenyl-3-methyl-5-hydroxy-6-metoxy-1,4-benzoquinol methylase
MKKYDFTLDLETDNSNSIILRWIKPQSTVLEFGPAHGRMTKFLKENLRCNITIIELDVESGTEAAKYADRALLGEIEGNIEGDHWVEKLQGSTFDYIIFADVLEHLHNPAQILARATGLLSANGSIIFSIPNIAHNSILIELWKNRFEYRSTGLLDETHLHFFSQTSLTKLVRQTGLYVYNEHNARNVVENTEFKHSLADMPPEVASAMAKRDYADVYQFVWELKKARWAQPHESPLLSRPQAGTSGRAPKISVLLPNYNYGCYLESAIESILGQDFADFEFIISDDASSDKSAEIIKAYAARDARIKYYIQPANLGMVANWNWCLQEARGEYIKYLFGDDRLVCPHALRTLAGMLDANPGAMLATSARQVINAEGKVIDLWNCIKRSGLNKRDLVARRCLFSIQNCIGEPTAVMFRASAARRGFDSSYRQVVDLEMWLHLLKQGDLAYTTEPLCQFRNHAEQQTAANGKTQIGYHEHMRLNEDYFPCFKPQNSSLPFRERRILARVIYSLEKGKNIPSAAKQLAPFLKLQLGPGWYRFFRSYRWIFHKLSRPFANARRAWRKHVRKDPSYWRKNSQA